MIAPGDLVVVTRPSACGSTECIGRIFCVRSVIDAETTSCLVCGDGHGPARVALETDVGFETWRLRRLDHDAGPQSADVAGTSTQQVESVNPRGGAPTSLGNPKPDRARSHTALWGPEKGFRNRKGPGRYCRPAYPQVSRQKNLPPRVHTLKPTMASGDSWRGDKRTAHQRGYTHRWQKYREHWLRAHPLCGDRLEGSSPEHSLCLQEGRATAARVVDHIKAHQGDQTLFWSPSNHQSLCTHCHDSYKATIERQGGAGCA